MARLKSSTTPGSYSIVVRDPVDPITEACRLPFSAPAFWAIRASWSVMFEISGPTFKEISMLSQYTTVELMSHLTPLHPHPPFPLVEDPPSLSREQGGQGGGVCYMAPRSMAFKISLASLKPGSSAMALLKQDFALSRFFISIWMRPML
jgi:hypothetical protein